MSTNKKNKYMRIADIAGFVADYSPDQLKFKNYELPCFIINDDGKEMVEAEELLFLLVFKSSIVKSVFGCTNLIDDRFTEVIYSISSSDSWDELSDI